MVHQTRGPTLMSVRFAQFCRNELEYMLSVVLMDTLMLRERFYIASSLCGVVYFFRRA